MAPRLRLRAFAVCVMATPFVSDSRQFQVETASVGRRRGVSAHDLMTHVGRGQLQNQKTTTMNEVKMAAEKVNRFISYAEESDEFNTSVRYDGPFNARVEVGLMKTTSPQAVWTLLTLSDEACFSRELNEDGYKEWLFVLQPSYWED